MAIGCAVGLAGLAVFVVLHAVIVRPIWTQAAVGVPFVLAIGLAMSWAFHEFVAAAPSRLRASGGLRFGALMWLAAWPATALANVMRVRTHAVVPAWFDGMALLLALAGGAIALWATTRSRRGTIAGALAAATLLAAAGGPLPVLRGGRVAELWLGLFILDTIGGALLALMYHRWAAPRGDAQ